MENGPLHPNHLRNESVYCSLRLISTGDKGSKGDKQRVKIFLRQTAGGKRESCFHGKKKK